MDDLIIRYLQGLASEDEERYLREWIAGDRELDRWFRSIEATWKLVGAAAPEAAAARLPNVDAIIARAAQAPTQPSITDTPAVNIRDWAAEARSTLLPFRASRGWGMLAATLAFAVLGLGALFRSAVEPSGTPISAFEIVAGDGERVRIGLDNGSAILVVQPRSALRVDQGGVNPVVWAPY